MSIIKRIRGKKKALVRCRKRKEKMMVQTFCKGGLLSNDNSFPITRLFVKTQECSFKWKTCIRREKKYN